MTTEMAGDVARFLTSENARLKAENRELRDLVSMLREFVMTLLDIAAITDRFGAADDLLGLLNTILYNTLAMLRATDGSIMLLDEAANELVFAVAVGDVGRALVGYRIPVSVGIAGWCVEHREACIVNDVRVDPRFSPLVDQTFVFEALNKQTDEPFDEMDQALLELLGRFVGEALARIEAMPFPEAGDGASA